MKIIVLICSVLVAAKALALTPLKFETPQSLKDTLKTEASETTAAIQTAHDLKSREAALRELKVNYDKAKKQVQDRVEALRAKGGPEFKLADQKEDIILDYWLAYEITFDEFLSAKAAEPQARKKMCHDVPETIRFDELAQAPAGTPLSEHRTLAIATVTALCAK